MNEFDLFFVAFKKHGAIQHLVKGPFVCVEDAMHDETMTHPYCVVAKCTLPFTIVED